MPSRASTAFSQCAVWSSLPGGLVVLIATYCESRARLAPHGTPLGVRAGHVRLELPRGQEDGLRGRAEQAGLGRRGRARRVRAGDRKDQREERGATHESSGWRRENSQAIGGGVRGRAPRRQCTVIVAWPVLPSLVARKM